MTNTKITCLRRKSVTDSVKGVMRCFCVFEDPVIHIAQIARFNRAAKLVSKNVAVVAVTLPQTTLFEKLLCPVDKKLLQHCVSEWNHAISFFRFGRSLDNLRSFALTFDVRRFFLHTLQSASYTEFLRSKVDIAPFERTQLADAQSREEVELDSESQPVLLRSFNNRALLFGLEHGNFFLILRGQYHTLRNIDRHSFVDHRLLQAVLLRA